MAIVDNFGAEGQGWCDFLIKNGHSCTLFPKEGPTAPLDSFDVVVDMSGHWSDPGGSLADFMRAGKTVIVAKSAPGALGIQSNTTVQAWIGANGVEVGDLDLVTVARDPILGDIPPGTFITDCGAGVCLALYDTSGHPNAKVLAAFTYGPDPDPIGIMRNVWEGGVSVFFTHNIGADPMLLNAVNARALTIPAVTGWGVATMGLVILVMGSAILLPRRRARRNSDWGP